MCLLQDLFYYQASIHLEPQRFKNLLRYKDKAEYLGFCLNKISHEKRKIMSKTWLIDPEATKRAFEKALDVARENGSLGLSFHVSMKPIGTLGIDIEKESWSMGLEGSLYATLYGNIASCVSLFEVIIKKDNSIPHEMKQKLVMVAQIMQGTHDDLLECIRANYCAKFGAQEHMKV